MGSYSVRCLFRWNRYADQSPEEHLYEERITLWQADSFEQALEFAEQEAHEYARDNDAEFLNYSIAFWLTDPLEATNKEIFSLLRTSPLEPEGYIDAFFDTGKERAGPNVAERDE